MYAKKYFSVILNNRMPPRDLSQYNFANSFDKKSRRIYTMKPINYSDNYAVSFFSKTTVQHIFERALQFIAGIELDTSAISLVVQE